MNRLKLWVYVALVLVVGLGNTYFITRGLARRAVAQADHDLTVAAAQVDARAQLLAAEAARLADVIARDPNVAQALSPEGSGNALAAARATAGAIGGSSGPLLLGAAGRGEKAFEVGGAAVQADERASALLSAATTVGRHEGHALAGGSLYYLVAVPAGAGSSVAVGVPLSAGWLQQLQRLTGAQLTLLIDGRERLSTLAKADAALVAGAARPGGGPADAGALGRQRPTVGAPFPSPLPLLFARAPAFRSEAVALKGMPGAALVVSQPLGHPLSAVVGYAWSSLLMLAVLVLAGIAIGMSFEGAPAVAAAPAPQPVEPRALPPVETVARQPAQPVEQPPAIPRELVAAAERVAGGDFAARAPALAGGLGLLADAINRSAEAVQAARAAERAAVEARYAAEEAHRETAKHDSALDAPLERAIPTDAAHAPSPSDLAAEILGTEPFRAAEGGSTAVARSEPLATELFTAVPPLPPAQAEAEPAAAAPPAEQAGGDTLTAGSAPPQPEPLAAEPLPPEPIAAVPPPAPAPSPVDAAPSHAAASGEVPGAGSAPGPGATPAEAPPPKVVAPRGASDEKHWQAVYEEYVRIRAECGELGPMPYPNFRRKLEKNRDQLVAKYACRTVRFRVCVKEGKATVKASPVR